MSLHIPTFGTYYIRKYILKCNRHPSIYSYIDPSTNLQPDVTVRSSPHLVPPPISHQNSSSRFISMMPSRHLSVHLLTPRSHHLHKNTVTPKYSGYTYYPHLHTALQEHYPDSAGSSIVTRVAQITAVKHCRRSQNEMLWGIVCPFSSEGIRDGGWVVLRDLGRLDELW